MQIYLQDPITTFELDSKILKNVSIQIKTTVSGTF